jgi:hypothetical protein
VRARAGAFVVSGQVERQGENTIFVVARVVRRAPGGPPPRTRLP